jgi:hypothetical protein
MSGPHRLTRPREDGMRQRVSPVRAINTASPGADSCRMTVSPTLVAMLVASLTGWGIVRHCKAVLNNGIGFADGGGWAVILLVETMVFLAAVNVATF